MIAAMPRPRKPHLHRERNRHGTHVWYVRKGQGPRYRLRGEFGSDEFNAQYEAAIVADKSFGPAHYKLSTVLMRMNELQRAAAERQLGAELNAAMMKAGKTVLVLAEPDGTLISDLSQEQGHR